MNALMNLFMWLSQFFMLADPFLSVTPKVDVDLHLAMFVDLDLELDFDLDPEMGLEFNPIWDLNFVLDYKLGLDLIAIDT